MITASRETDQLLSDWVILRQDLEQSNTPLEDVVEFFLSKPRVKVYTDPYDKSTWPTPWELITENTYCGFNVLLGICYTLQLTSRFSSISPKIEIAVDRETFTVYYLLIVNNMVYGYLDQSWIPAKQLPNTLKTQKIFTMDPLH